MMLIKYTHLLFTHVGR